MCPNTTERNPDNPARDRALRLIRYLQELAALRASIIRDVETYENVIWLHEIPREKGCFTQAWGPNEEIGGDVWVEVQKANEPALPRIPEVCEPWANRETITNTDGRPELFSSITVPAEVQDVEAGPPQPAYEERKLADYPDIQQAWDQYIEQKWLPWAELHRRWALVQKVYAKLFAIHQEQQRLGEEYELVLGLGFLTWLTPSGHQVRRHLVTAKASLEFESRLGKFTVGPDPDGAKLSAELDMLDVEEQPFRAQQSAMDGLRSADENPWDRVSVDSVLHGLAKALHDLGEYHHESLKPRQSLPEKKPFVDFAPALILRKRSLRGFRDILSKMHAQISEGGAIPSEFLDLAEGRVCRERSGLEQADQHGADKPEDDPTVYFPKPSNEEQRRIIKTLLSTSGVLVQGPPGTGKSHTIANLICHLLATGQRVLVTAQTPRALEVLQGHLPEQIRPLCISLLGSGNKEQRALEASVSGILARENHWNEATATAQAKQLLAELHQLRKDSAGIHFRLRSIREAETHSQSILNGAYQGTAAKIAKQLSEEKINYGWLTDFVRYDQELPITQHDLEKLREELLSFTPEREAEVELRIPDLERDLLPPARFQHIVQRETEATTYLETNQALLNSQADQRVHGAEVNQVENIIAAVEALFSAIQRIKSRPMPWIEAAIQNMLSDNDLPWKELHRISEEILRGLRERAALVDRQELNAPTNLERRKLLHDAKVLKRYFDQGGTIRWPWFLNKKIVKKNEHLIKHVRFDGHLCDSAAILAKLIEYLSVEQAIEYGWNIWKGKAEKREATLFLQVAELEEHLEALTRVVGLFDLLEHAKGTIRQVPGMAEPVWYDLDALQRFLESCRFVIAKHNLESIQQELSKYITSIRALMHDEHYHPLVHKVLNCMRTRDGESYENMFRKILDLHQASERLKWVKSTLGRLTQLAPAWGRSLKETCHDVQWVARLRSVEKAWAWARAKSWLRDFLNADDVPSLERRAKQLEEDERNILAKLAEIHAWRFCFMRLEETHRRHLVGWQQAIRRLGRGTGRHAHRHKQDAKRQLNKCRDAVPAWVMPLHRLWDTVDPSPEMFDVIIVDEASQCGPDSLPLMYLGKKLLVVGDDQQISPEAVGINEDAVFRLRQEYLDGFEHAPSFGINTSFFDHGKLRFGNRIVLREHFRCMPEIIRFSNDLCYHDTPLIPLRQYPPERIDPLKITHVANGYRQGDGAKAINRPEAEALVRQVVQCCQDDRYTGRSMGVIVLQGEVQAQLIESLLVKELGAEEIENRRLLCGNPYHFQGDERDVIFLSMVAAPNQRIGAFTKATDQRRFNVAASRARDQLWLFHTATLNDLSVNCLRKRLLEFFLNPQSQISQALGEEAEQLRERAYSANRQIERPPQPYESWFELDVCLAIAERGYRVVPQYRIAGKFIDLVVEGQESQLAVECDGDHWHGPEQYDADMERQRRLERSGWQFYRIRECLFNANSAAALEGLWPRLKQLKIYPVGTKESARPFFSNEQLIELDDFSVERHSDSSVTSELTVKRSKEETTLDFMMNSSIDQPEESQTSNRHGQALKTSASTFQTLENTSSEEIEFSGYQAPYAHWQSKVLPDPRSATSDEILKGLLDIISVEGPIICYRAYFLYARAVVPPILRVGGQIRSIFNNAVSKALRQGLLEGRDEHGNRELYCRIVRKKDTPFVAVRKRGNRDFDEIPPSELGTMMKYLHHQNPHHKTDELFQAVLERYEFGRMSSNIKDRLLKIRTQYVK